MALRGIVWNGVAGQGRARAGGQARAGREGRGKAGQTERADRAREEWRVRDIM